MIDTNRLVNILIDYCEWNASIDGWIIKDEDLDKYIELHL